MIIWRNEATPPSLERTGISPDIPHGPVEITRIEDYQDGRAHIWYTPVPATPAGDMPPDPVGMLTAMAGMHHEWFEAWQAAGFSEIQAYGLVAEIVRSAFSSDSRLRLDDVGDEFRRAADGLRQGHVGPPARVLRAQLPHQPVPLLRGEARPAARFAASR